MLISGSKNANSGYKNTTYETVFKEKDDWCQNSKTKFQKFIPGATKNSLNAIKKIIKKAFLEIKLY